jgi:hypothetical protein
MTGLLGRLLELDGLLRGGFIRLVDVLLKIGMYSLSSSSSSSFFSSIKEVFFSSMKEVFFSSTKEVFFSIGI